MKTRQAAAAAAPVADSRPWLARRRDVDGDRRHGRVVQQRPPGRPSGDHDSDHYRCRTDDGCGIHQ
jgi:hypothetical protein